jgi:putative SOS response-associated peptidase YedK
MCARYTLSKKQEAILKAYAVQIAGEYKPNYNLAITQKGLVITADEPKIAQLMHFGLVPYTASKPEMSSDNWNARSETAISKQTYAPLIKHHKTCLVLADGFYEWDRKTGKPIPYRFVLKERELFAFAGLWSQWKSEDGSIVYRSFTIMTTEANKVVSKVHDPKFRMPVILDKYSEPFWLSKDISPAELLNLCKPYPDEKMDVFQVGTEVNSTVIKGQINNKPELVLPLNSQ